MELRRDTMMFFIIGEKRWLGERSDVYTYALLRCDFFLKDNFLFVYEFPFGGTDIDCFSPSQ